jgi:uncharacterized protein
MARFEMYSADASAAAYGGGSDALFQLGLMYCAGRDVALDYVTAHKWFNLAALSGNAEAKQYRAEISREMSKADIAKAQRMAREWMRQTAV